MIVRGDFHSGSYNNPNVEASPASRSSPEQSLIQGMECDSLLWGEYHWPALKRKTVPGGNLGPQTANVEVLLPCSQGAGNRKQTGELLSRGPVPLETLHLASLPSSFRFRRRLVRNERRNACNAHAGSVAFGDLIRILQLRPTTSPLAFMSLIGTIMLVAAN